MRRASTISVIVTTFFYLCCGCAGYAAFGNDTPGNLLTGFAAYKLYWLVDFANACIVIHLVGAYQVHITYIITINFVSKFTPSPLIHRSNK
jgi:amino acid permease